MLFNGLSHPSLTAKISTETNVFVINHGLTADCNLAVLPFGIEGMEVLGLSIEPSTRTKKSLLKFSTNMPQRCTYSGSSDR